MLTRRGTNCAVTMHRQSYRQMTINTPACVCAHCVQQQEIEERNYASLFGDGRASTRSPLAFIRIDVYLCESDAIVRAYSRGPQQRHKSLFLR